MGGNRGDPILFFFSSRRRHTRSDRDWSSDVCSSDLMIDQNGRPVTKQALKTCLATYNAGVRGSKEFGALPRALITICDNLALGKTTYVK